MNDNNSKVINMSCICRRVTLVEWTLFIHVVASLMSWTQASWWLLGTEVNYHHNPMNDVDPEKFNNLCSGFPHFVQRQKYLCLKSNKVFAAIREGARLGIQECQTQLNQHRWNCSIVREAENVFGEVLNIQSREKAYIHAISAASLAFEITKACARGELEDCSCDEHVRGRNTKGKWQWGGCSEDVKYGTLFSKEFADSMESPDTAVGLMNLHNNEAGRRLLKTSMNMSCKCHGVSGSCTMKVCWRVLPTFRSVGEKIAEKFEGAFHVKPVNRGLNKKGHKHSKISLKPRLQEMKRPTKKDLVFIDESPDYCEQNNTINILGTRGRVCNRSSDGPDGCKLLCCGRGYQTMLREGFESCNCQFVWCCRVQCESCPFRRDEYICN